MKKDTVQIETEAAKVNAIRFYLNGKDGGLEAELTEYVDILYKKYVPVQVREYIEKADNKDNKPTKKPAKKQPENKAVSDEISGEGINTRKSN